MVVIFGHDKTCQNMPDNATLTVPLAVLGYVLCSLSQSPAGRRARGTQMPRYGTEVGAQGAGQPGPGPLPWPSPSANLVGMWKGDPGRSR